MAPKKPQQKRRAMGKNKQQLLEAGVRSGGLPERFVDTSEQTEQVKKRHFVYSNPGETTRTRMTSSTIESQCPPVGNSDQGKDHLFKILTEYEKREALLAFFIAMTLNDDYKSKPASYFLKEPNFLKLLACSKRQNGGRRRRASRNGDDAPQETMDVEIIMGELKMDLTQKEADNMDADLISKMESSMTADGGGEEWEPEEGITRNGPSHWLYQEIEELLDNMEYETTTEATD